MARYLLIALALVTALVLAPVSAQAAAFSLSGYPGANNYDALLHADTGGVTGDPDGLYQGNSWGPNQEWGWLQVGWLSVTGISGANYLWVENFNLANAIGTPQGQASYDGTYNIAGGPVLNLYTLDDTPAHQSARYDKSGSGLVYEGTLYGTVLLTKVEIGLAEIDGKWRSFVTLWGEGLTGFSGGFYLNLVDHDASESKTISSVLAQATGTSDIRLDVAGGGTTPVVPEPGTLVLLGSGLAGLVYFRRRKTAKA